MDVGWLEQGVLMDESILMGVGIAGAGVTNRRVHIDESGDDWSRGY